MFVATPAFRNKGAIHRNGEISDFHNASCSGTGPLLPTTALLSASCTNATTSGSADHATNDPHKPLNIYISFKCRISWPSGQQRAVPSSGTGTSEGNKPPPRDRNTLHRVCNPREQHSGHLPSPLPAAKLRFH